NPAVLHAGNGLGVAFSTDGTYMAVAHVTTPFITIYKRSGDVFTKLANPAVLPAQHCNGVAFSTDGTYMAVAHTTTPFITIYVGQGVDDPLIEFRVPRIDVSPITTADALPFIKAED
ncbi:MAG TPA: hypothetical protein VIC30_12635, partial [Orrella sp.]